eukprot:1403021-Rhodomonas_salina.3
MKTLIAWIRSDLERPLAKRLHGGEGSGKSFVLAAIASRIMQVGPDTGCGLQGGTAACGLLSVLAETYLRRLHRVPVLVAIDWQGR